MSEKEIRRIIKEVCADLDRHASIRALALKGARKVVLPAMLGAGLALGGCTETRMMYGVPMPDGQVMDSQVADGKVVGAEAGTPDAIYMAPDAGIADMAQKTDTGPQIDYMAPDAAVKPPDGLPIPPYMAPNPDKGQMKEDGGSDYSGPKPLYMASIPKEGPKHS